MAKKFSLLLLDANVVIHLFKLGIWQRLIERCDVHLAGTVVEEAQFYADDDGERHYIDLSRDIDSGAISTFDILPSQLQAFRERFDPGYFERLDPGETESLVSVMENPEDALLCSADKIVYRVLGNLRLGEAGISLEEVLKQIGLGRALRREFTREYRLEWTLRGSSERIQGIGLRGEDS